MRKITEATIEAIKANKKLTKANMVVDSYTAGTDRCSNVYLHNNHIAQIRFTETGKCIQLLVNDYGWQSNTTKERLNAIIREFTDSDRNGITQKKLVWTLSVGEKSAVMQSGKWHKII